MPDVEFWICLAILGVVATLAVVQGRIKDQLNRVEKKLDSLQPNPTNLRE